MIKKKRFTFLKCRFEVDVPGPMDFDVEGDFIDHEYVFTCGGRATAVAIDLICHDGDDD